MSRTSRALKGTLTGFLQYGLQIVLQIALAPLVLRVAGQETLGAYAILLQAVGYIGLVNFGFAVAANRFLAQAYGFDDGGRRLGQVMSTLRTYALFINLIASLLFISLSVWVGPLLSLPPAIESQAQTSLYLLAGWIIICPPLFIYGVSLVGTQNLAAANLVAILGNGARLGLSLALVAAGMGLTGLMAAYILADCLTMSLNTWIFRRRFPEVRLSWGFPDLKLFKEMFNFGKKAFPITLAGHLIFQSDNMVVGYLYGAALASIYYSTQMPAYFLYHLAIRLTENSGPGINELYARKLFEPLRRVFIQLHRYSWIFILPVGLGFFFLSKPMITLWVGPAQYGGDSMVLALSLFVIIFTIANVNKTFIIASGQIGNLNIFALTEGIINLILSLVLGYHYGISGVIWATIIANIPTSYYLQRHSQQLMKVTTLEYLRVVLKPLIVPLSIGIVSIVILNKTIPVNAWLSFLSNLIIFLLIYAIITYLFLIDYNERLQLKQGVYSFLRNINPLRVTG